jgi:hypothetical protein
MTCHSRQLWFIAVHRQEMIDITDEVATQG